MGSADEDSDASAHSRRLAKWASDSADLRAATAAPGDPDVVPEVAAMARYRRSRTTVVRLPHPMVSARRYDALTRRRSELARRTTLLLLLTPLLVVLGAVLDPLALQVAIWALLLPAAGVAVHHRRVVRAIDRERHVTLRGGLADAWSDWVAARAQLQALDHASQARAALGANEDRMHTLVLALGRADAAPDHRDAEEHAASRAWVYRSAATAGALVAAEQDLELESRRDAATSILEIAPDGDIHTLEHALDTARALARDDPSA